ncbi:unnamed protein product [Parnassius apollo]|uniref:(apollo) hypothetical protein n=1 Tax=Parnassius apollo TaxID=110799 RepID=A0A8S3WHR3_PARAO|nr:unnamed protein product [Parnassius apollo]
MVLGAILMTGASLTAGFLVIQMAVLPLLFKYSKSVQRKMVFSNCINYPRNLDYNKPSSCNIVGARNFNIEFHSKEDHCTIKLGVWHIVPSCLFKELFVVRDHLDSNTRLLKELKRTQNTVVLYCHGYGDSTRVRPTERGVVEDTLHVYSWILESVNRERRPMVLIWGHSLGTAVAANLVANLSTLCADLGQRCLPPPDALILEAPFNNLIEEIESHPFSKLVSWLPYYKTTILDPFASSSEYSFTTDQYLESVPHVPILILHSKSDKIVPYDLAVKLYDSAERSRRAVGSEAPILLHGFERGRGLGHNNLCQAPDLPQILRCYVIIADNCEICQISGLRRRKDSVAFATTTTSPDNLDK